MVTVRYQKGYDALSIRTNEARLYTDAYIAGLTADLSRITIDKQ
jgi:hypothetical protein